MTVSYYINSFMIEGYTYLRIKAKILKKLKFLCATCVLSCLIHKYIYPLKYSIKYVYKEMLHTFLWHTCTQCTI